MDVSLQLGLECVDPLHRVQRLEAGMLHWLLDIGQGIKGQKLACLREFSTTAVQVSFELRLCGTLLLLSPRSEVLVIVRVEDVNNEVEVQVKLKLLGYEVAPEHFFWDEHFPSLKERLLITLVKTRAESIEERLAVVIQPVKVKKDRVRGFEIAVGHFCLTFSACAR